MAALAVMNKLLYFSPSLSFSHFHVLAIIFYALLRAHKNKIQPEVDII